MQIIEEHVPHIDAVFAPLDRDHTLLRIAGGNETEVYRSDDGRYVIKVKHDLGGDRDDALRAARRLDRAARRFADCLGPEYSIASHYVISCDDEGVARVLLVQPYLNGARPLAELDYTTLSDDQRAHLASQLRDIIRRALMMYRRNGLMPDLYGRRSTSKAERRRLNGPLMLPWRLWSFLVKRNLLRSQNLLVTEDDALVLVDYDPVRRGPLYKALYYGVRFLLFWRDHTLVLVMKKTGRVP
ncbi:hypothetical protein HC891_22380 [Candidatus Gracilibacteria bacterium]|nr:hypothetical protein [Candidatus Gracilibacteria bacterium]